MRHFILSLGFLFSSFVGASSRWGMNDVSILLPLPKTEQYSELLSPLSQGSRGALLPKEIYDRFPLLTQFTDPSTLYTQNLKVVGIRLDPCFQEGLMGKCQKQIRLIWQPLFELRGKTITADAALHSFYQFDDQTWKTVLSAWEKVKSQDHSQSLQIHPNIVSEGYSGKSWNYLKNTILQFCGNENLIRVTGMRTNAARVWIFLGFDRIDASWKSMSIPRIGIRKTQTFMTTAEGIFNLNEFESSIIPYPADEPQLGMLVANSIDFKNERSEDDSKKILITSLQFENPKTHNPGTIDCVSCHIAQATHLWVEKNFKTDLWSQELKPHQYQSSLNLKNNSINPSHTNRVRSFGYFEDEPIFSQRVINESAEVIKLLESTTP